jgi:hypothetical protein
MVKAYNTYYNESSDEVSMFRQFSLCLASSCFLLFIIGGCGGGGSSTPPVQISVSISPTLATVTAGNSQQFNASVSGTVNAVVTWSVVGGTSNGTISTTGLYFAPTTVPTPAQITVIATSQADTSKSASATVTVQIGVQVEPPTVTLQVLGMQQFFANVTGTSNAAVTWSVVGGTANGTITASGSYTAPAAVPNPAQVTVKAISQVDTTQFGTATVTVIPIVPSITVQPNPGGVTVFGSQQFVAFPNNLSSNAVTWQVNGVTGGSQQTGFISSSGLYIAPGAVPTASNGKGQSTPTTVTVTAVSQVNPTVSGSAIVTFDNSPAQNLTSYFGMSGGNQMDSQTSGNSIYCCSGTLGSAVTRGGILYILSNNHVLARDDLGTVTSGTTPGDNIIQPGLIDANCGQGIFDIIGNLSQFYNLETGLAPKIDAAIALPVQSGVVDANGRILYLGATTDANNVPLPDAPHGGIGLPETSSLLNRAVAKSGRTTGLTCSTIFSISTTVSVQYQKGCRSGTTFQETFTNQIDVTGGSFSSPGDSGSLIVTQDTADPVALLFAGSDQDTVGNPVGDVLNYFQSGGNAVTFVGGGTHPVIGCTLPTAPASAVSTTPLSAVGDQDVQRATRILDANAHALMAHPEVQAVGVGASLDHSGEPAILFFVTKSQPRTGIPAIVEGIRTRIIEGDQFAQRDVLSSEQSEALEQSVPAPHIVYPISESEFARAKAIYVAYGEEWMNKAGVQGVGIGSSADSPGEATLVIFLIRGVAHESVPPVIDGLRTRIRESRRFRAGFGDEQPRRSCSMSAPNPFRAKPVPTSIRPR